MEKLYEELIMCIIKMFQMARSRILSYSIILKLYLPPCNLLIVTLIISKVGRVCGASSQQSCISFL